LVVLAIVVLVAAGLYWQLGGELSLASIAQREAELRELQHERPLAVYGIAFLAYVVVTGLSLPGAAGLSLVYGWLFGFWRGVVLVSFASTTGATIAFLLSRFLLGDFVRTHYTERLHRFQAALRTEGPFFLFALRLIPVVPFFVINLVMGLTPIRTRTFWWVSQLGMLPGTCAYLYAGSSVPGLDRLANEGVRAVFSGQQLFQLAVAFGLLAVLPFVLRFLLRATRRALDRSPS
jgi:uncharacterized membrane protein YdjX (TVP38/TMEM64 family)